MVAKEGPKSLFRGVGAPIVGAMLENSVFIPFFHLFMCLYRNPEPFSKRLPFCARQLMFWGYGLSGKDPAAPASTPPVLAQIWRKMTL